MVKKAFLLITNSNEAFSLRVESIVVCWLNTNKRRNLITQTIERENFVLYSFLMFLLT